MFRLSHFSLHGHQIKFFFCFCFFLNQINHQLSLLSHRVHDRVLHQLYGLQQRPPLKYMFVSRSVCVCVCVRACACECFLVRVWLLFPYCELLLWWQYLTRAVCLPPELHCAPPLMSCFPALLWTCNTHTHTHRWRERERGVTERINVWLFAHLLSFPLMTVCDNYRGLLARLGAPSPHMTRIVSVLIRNVLFYTFSRWQTPIGGSQVEVTL